MEHQIANIEVVNLVENIIKIFAYNKNNHYICIINKYIHGNIN